MKYKLRARVIEGCDEWFDRNLQSNGKYNFVKTKNENLCLDAPYSQEGFNALFNVGKDLWDAGMCSKFEIAVFVDGRMFWKHRPDKYNFSDNPYFESFESMIKQEDLSFRSEDFQNDALELKYVEDYQKAFWDGRNVICTVEYFKQTVQDTALYDGLLYAKKVLDSGVSLPEHLGFRHNDTWIVNPFFDETLRFDVEPLSYYGVDNVRQFVVHLEFETGRFNKNVDKLACVDDILHNATPRSTATETGKVAEIEFDKEQM